MKIKHDFISLAEFCSISIEIGKNNEKIIYANLFPVHIVGTT